jgi:hypothetical protein
MTEIAECILIGCLILALLSICWSAKIIFCEDNNRYDGYNPISVNDDNT